MLNLTRWKEIADAATKTVAWHPHKEDSTVRGPYHRWFKCAEGDMQYSPRISEVEKDIEYCAAAMNAMPLLIAEVEGLRVENNQLAFECDRAKEDRDKAEARLVTLREIVEVAEGALQRIAGVYSEYIGADPDQAREALARIAEMRKS